ARQLSTNTRRRRHLHRRPPVAGRDGQRPLPRACLPPLPRARRHDFRRPDPASHLLERIGLRHAARCEPLARLAGLLHAAEAGAPPRPPGPSRTQGAVSWAPDATHRTAGGAGTGPGTAASATGRPAAHHRCAGRAVRASHRRIRRAAADHGDRGGGRLPELPHGGRRGAKGDRRRRRRLVPGRGVTSASLWAAPRPTRSTGRGEAPLLLVPSPRWRERNPAGSLLVQAIFRGRRDNMRSTAVLAGIALLASLPVSAAERTAKAETTTFALSPTGNNRTGAA